MAQHPARRSKHDMGTFLWLAGTYAPASGVEDDRRGAHRLLRRCELGHIVLARMVAIVSTVPQAAETAPSMIEHDATSVQ